MGDAGHTDAAAEIDLIENYLNSAKGQDMSRVQSNFAECDPGIYNRGYTAPYCKASHWNERATDISHHITLSAQDQAEGRVIEIRRCPQVPGHPKTTCTEGDF